MKQIALLHTVKSVLNTFEPRIHAAMSEEVIVHNILDDFLASDPAVCGIFTQNNLNRLFYDLKAAELTGADAIMASCSTLTPSIKKIRPFISVPVLCIDDAMCEKAVSIGSKILILATAQSTIEPTKSNLLAYAKHPLNITVNVCDEAYTAIKKLDSETHDRLLLNIAHSINNYDVIVLAQASMAHLEAQIEGICGCPVLSSPKLGIEQLKQTLFPKG